MYSSLKGRFIAWAMPGETHDLRYPLEDYHRALGVVFDGLVFVVLLVSAAVLVY